VVDTAKAMFEVENYSQFVSIQSEAALRSLVMQYSYEDYEQHHKSLIKNMDEVTEKLKQEVQARLEVAGIEIIEARISHLAYAPEIAAAMLQRQQAKAVVAARTEIVDGAVGMVEMALAKIEDKQLVKFDEQTKARLVSNLMIVLVSDQNAMPVVETNM
jgi:regulator of protease activity HflC (stomatin/prohibitin superfamily)